MSYLGGLQRHIFTQRITKKNWLWYRVISFYVFCAHNFTYVLVRRLEEPKSKIIYFIEDTRLKAKNHISITKWEHSINTCLGNVANILRCALYGYRLSPTKKKICCEKQNILFSDCICSNLEEICTALENVRCLCNYNIYIYLCNY
jgi:hypothetical protein